MERLIKVYRCLLFNVKLKPLQIKIIIISYFLKKRYCGRHRLLAPQFSKKVLHVVSMCLLDWILCATQRKATRLGWAMNPLFSRRHCNKLQAKSKTLLPL